MKTLAVCMIVKDEGRFLDQTLTELASAVNEIVVVDTGSTDNTKEIAEKHGVKLFDFKWNDDFAAARNFAKSKATSDWILILDGDELFRKEDIAKLRKIIEEKPHAGILLPARNYKPVARTRVEEEDGKKQVIKEYTDYTVSWKVRAFQNDPKIEFVGNVHEDVSQSIIKNFSSDDKKPLLKVDIPIHHMSFAKGVEDLKTKQKKYFELSKEKLKNAPTNPKVHLDLAAGYLFFENNIDRAVFHLKESLKYCGVIPKAKEETVELAASTKNYKAAVKELVADLNLAFVTEEFFDAQSFSNLARGFFKQKRYAETIVIIEKLRELDSYDTSLLELLAVSYVETGDSQKAAEALTYAIQHTSDNPLLYFNLGAVRERLKDYEGAIEAFEEFARLDPRQKAAVERRIEKLQQLAKQ